MDVTRTLTEVMELLELADAESTRGGKLHKAGDKVNKATVADHHDKMAEYHAAMADKHSQIADAYGKGTVRKGADADAGTDDDDVPAAGTGGRTYGALEAVRGRLSKRDTPLTRATFMDMLEEHDKNFMKSLVDILRPPSEQEVNAEDQAAIKALREKGYSVEDASLSQRSVHKPVLVRDPDVIDKAKVDGKGADTTVADETKLAVLKLRAAGEGADAIQARAELNILATATLRKSLNDPQVSDSGQMAGFRGRGAAR